MTKIRLNNNEKKTTPFPDFEVECVPAKGDVLHVGGIRHVVTEREFWIDHDRIDHVTLHISEMK